MTATARSEELLLQAAKTGALQEVQRLLMEGVRLADCEDEHGSSALHLAAIAGQSEMVRLLLRQRADLKAMNIYFRQPIHEAVASGDVETLRVLAEAGASLLAPDDDGWKPVHYAASIGSLEMLEEIAKRGGLSHDDSLNGTPLAIAVKDGHDDASRWLVQRGASPDEALLYLCKTADVRVIKLLLELGANPECETTDGWRPACMAAMAGHRAKLEALLDDPRSSRETLNLTYLAARGAKRREVEQLLLQRGADQRVAEIVDRIPSDEVWSMHKLRRLLNAELMAANLESAMGDRGDVRPARGFSL